MGRNLRAKFKLLKPLLALLKRPGSKPTGANMQTLVEYWFSETFSKHIQAIRAHFFDIETMLSSKSITKGLSNTEISRLRGLLENAISKLDNVEQANLQQLSCFLDDSVFGKLNYLITGNLHVHNIYISYPLNVFTNYKKKYKL